MTADAWQAYYEHLSGPDGPGNAPERLAWLNRDLNAYRPQPYEQLAGFYRRIGHDDDARRVLLAKQRTRSSALRPYARAWGYLLDWTVGYGYRPWLAGFWLLVLPCLGTTIFAADHPQPVSSGHGPHFNPLIYTFDLLIPISPFGMRDAFAPAGSSQWLAYTLIVTGWILVTAVIAGIARVLRRDWALPGASGSLRSWWRPSAPPCGAPGTVHSGNPGSSYQQPVNRAGMPAIRDRAAPRKT
jgi:hypothetical protein